MENPRTILVVDDDKEFTSSLSDFFTLEGYSVTVAHTGKDGLRLLRETPIFLAMIDLLLPDIEGTTLMREAQRLDPSPDVVIITGHAALDSAVAAVEAGAAGYIVKPVDLSSLGALVGKLFERRRLARENARLNEEIRTRAREVEEQSNQLVALHVAARFLATEHEIDRLLQRIVETATELIGARYGALAVFQDDGRVRRFFTAGLTPEERERIGAMPEGRGLLGRVFHQGQTLRLEDLGTNPAAAGFPPGHPPMRSFLGAPIRFRQEILGALYLTEKPGGFTAEDESLLNTLCADATVALENARLYEQVERDRRRLETLYDVSRRLAAVHETDQILSLIVNEAAHLLGAEAAGLRLVEGQDLVLRARTESAAVFVSRLRLRMGESLSGLIVTRGEPVVVEDLAHDSRYDPAHKRGALEHGFHGFLGVPLRAHGRTIGTLNVYTKNRRRFMAEEISFLSAFADQASLAIEKARLFREAEAREREATKLYEITGQLASSLDADRIPDLITAKTAELLGCDASGIFTHDDASGGLAFRRGLHLEHERTRDLALTLGQGVAWRAFKERCVVWTRDRLTDPTLQPVDDVPADVKVPRAYLAAPMISRGEALGVLMAYFFEPRDFTPREIRLLSTLAHHAATAIDNSRLFEEAQTQRVRLTQIFESTSDGIMLVGRSGLIVSANRRAGELLALDPAAVAGRNLGEVLAGLNGALTDRESTTPVLRSLIEDPDRSGEGDLEITAHARRVLHWIGQPTKDAAGATIGLTLTFQDVTQEREVSQMKSDFVSFVTHQLRTPLAGIKWLLELAVKEPSISEETLSYIQDSRESAERLIRLVNDLLDASRLESGRLTVTPQEVHLGELTRSVLDEVSVLIQDKGHRLSVAGTEEVQPVVVDPQLFRQVVLNLVSNAIKYTPAGGEIAVRMGREDGAVRWAISDSGIGIPKEAQHRLFEKFYRAENAPTMETEGTGLGLYLVRLIVERFGGRVWCESEEGKGSTFLFTLPDIQE